MPEPFRDGCEGLLVLQEGDDPLSGSAPVPEVAVDDSHPLPVVHDVEDALAPAVEPEHVVGVEGPPVADGPRRLLRGHPEGALPELLGVARFAGPVQPFQEHVPGQGKAADVGETDAGQPRRQRLEQV